MQFKFLSVLLLVGACFVQVSVSYPQNTDINPEIRGIIDDLINQAKNGIEKIQQLIVDQITKALEVFTQLKDQVSSIATAALDKAKEQLNAVISGALAQIAEIKQKADELGVNIQDCIADNEDKFKDLFTETFQNEYNCIQKEIDEALRIINEGIELVTTTLQTIQELPGKLYECGAGITSLVCIKDVIVETVRLQADIPLKVANKVQEVTKLVSGLQTRLTFCAASELTAAGIRAAEIVAEVGKCAADKIGSN